DASPAQVGDPVVKGGYGCHDPQDPDTYRIQATNVIDTTPAFAFTPRRSDAAPNEANLCPGDSGGALYRNTAPALLVVGVNALAGSVDYHARVDADSFQHVSTWLSEIGVRTRLPLATSPYGGVPSPVDGVIEAELSDLGPSGVAYFDQTSGNQ